MGGRRRKMDKESVVVWAWQIREGLCRWAEAYPGSLLKETKPSEEAKKIKCILMPYSEYLKLKRGKK